jgi:hypothetical protein
LITEASYNAIQNNGRTYRQLATAGAPIND